MPVEIAVLVCGARHPITQRPRRAAAEATALSIALSLDGSACSLIYAGPHRSEVLPWYCAAAQIRALHLQLGDDIDPGPPLARLVRTRNIDLVLCGVRAESPHASGLLPYRLAQELKWPLLPAVSDLRLNERTIVGTQHLPGAHSRVIDCALPALVTVAAGERALPFAWARFHNPRILRINGEGSHDPWCTRALERARPPAAPLAGVLFEGSAQQRLKQIFATRVQASERLVARDANHAAHAILARLSRVGALERPPDPTTPPSPASDDSRGSP